MSMHTAGKRLIALGAVFVLCTTTLAQSDRDLREENQRLQTEVNDLQRELEAAEKLIARLQEELKGLRTLAPAGPTTLPAPPVSIDESIPSASPRALLRAMKESYREATLDLEMGDPRTAPGRRQQAAYVRAVETWAKRIRRELKTAVEWTVQIVPMTHQTREPGELLVWALDPVTGTRLGDSFMVRLNKATRHKLGQLAERAELDELVLRGVLLPQVTINLDRHEVGPFDNPPFIGPYAEFGLIVESSSLSLPHPQQNPPKTPGAGT